MKTACRTEKCLVGESPKVAVCLEFSAIRKVKLSDIAPIFNLIQNCCRSGHFSNLCLLPPLQTSMALALFSTWIFGKIREPSGNWEKAVLYVIRYKGDFAGFALVHSLRPAKTSWKISLMAIEEKCRGQGLGRQLLMTIINNLQDSHTLECECLPKSVPMKSLLHKTGFKSISPVKAAIHKDEVEKFRLSGNLH